MRRRVPRSHAITAIFIATAGDRCRSIRSTEDVPEPAEPLSGLPVSYRISPFSSFFCLRTLASPHHLARESLAAGHGVAVATTTAARSRAHRRAHRNLSSP